MPATPARPSSTPAPTSSSVVLNHVTFAWPDGDVVLDDVTVAFGPGRTGLVGRNGAGKSTLLRLVAGELTPTSGAVTTHGDVAWVPQDLVVRDTGATVADLLGVGTRLRAFRAIESGEPDPARLAAHFEALADDWEVEQHAADAARACGLTAADLDRPAATLSGGETILAAVRAARDARASVTLLDEPTNNLDRRARERLHVMLDSWPGTLLVVSHDRELLDLLDRTAEVRTGAVDVFGGTFTQYEEHLAVEQDAAARAVRTAEQRLRAEKRDRIETETRLARSAKAGRKAAESMPKILANARKSAAEGTAGKRRGLADDRVDAARDAVDQAEGRVRDDDRVHVDLPGTAVPAGRRLVEVDPDRTVDGRGLVLQGPERVALVGDNGAGKSTLLDALLAGTGGRVLTDRVGYLHQRLVLGDERGGPAGEARTVLDVVRAAAPDVPPGQVRDRLARFLLRGRTVERPVGSLSGAERFRVALACQLLREPHLLVLDEPTNNLDLGTVDQLVDALAGYRGGLLVVSHDERFLERIGAGYDGTRPGRRWLVERGCGVREVTVLSA
ncbi:ABC-F family ATP-binding cassette domain-containing protein [Luteimicrobium subarcticum]|uniref:ATPase subunit of ABC transporter with duplicated ATPase domains n=1 Tax=Luteimicrobium subarcticum TaxID=620910 RepID=A0A2M8W1R3_9MICO|nr:ATP-binding cassette domain-containing protein [Luteimicrobium subarcticum]PJI84873.1 ATPase subunit of ABC transporter with duplicated ATPase domains [Luteimicrobium subarcticum]